ncbi:hypothetical protein HPB52_023098 [Rhipicephalus sanguineus]|uniref:Uncharacterized protein n=1 Tax=Rhipicephalus sanguineus TaxID=34632 RepID=A0A9D4Q835_RHISA|nr:hypothetical protein HPB52_023098 [Rhipicephalus sanguineus]
MRKERSFSGGLPDGGSPTRRRSGPRSHPSSSRMRFPPAAPAASSQVTTDFTVFLVPGLDVKLIMVPANLLLVAFPDTTIAKSDTVKSPVPDW